MAQPRILAIVPARGGSKGLPGKNVLPLCGKPLFVWSVEAALESKLVTLVHVSTDDEQIASLATAAGADVPYLRPSSISGDAAPTLDAVEFALNHYFEKSGQVFDYVLLLEPTSPIRPRGQLDQIIEKHVAASELQDAIVTVGAVREHPEVVKRIVGELLQPFQTLNSVRTRRQDYEPAYFPFGVAYLVKTAALLEERTFYPSRTGFFELSREQCHEIDDWFDFLAVESALKYVRGER